MNQNGRHIAHTLTVRTVKLLLQMLCWNMFWSTARLSLHQTWRPYTFIKTKLASGHLLHYVVYMCQKSLNSIHESHLLQAKVKGGII